MKASKDQLKLRDKIEVYHNNVIPVYFATSFTCSATVIALPKPTSSNDHFVFGWKPDEIMICPVPIKDVDWNIYMLHDQWSQFTHYQYLNSGSEIHSHQSGSCVIGHVTVCQEQPCFICSKMNDVGVNKCWWCGGVI